MPKLQCNCGYWMEFEFEDGYGECFRCNSEFDLPGCQESLDKWNAQTSQELEDARYTGRTIIMRIDECGEERHVATLEKGQEEIADLVASGAKEQFPESNIFTVREENQRFLAEQYNMDDGIF